MASINTYIPTFSDVNAMYREAADAAEVKFWKDTAHQLQRDLENIWDAAKEHGRIELVRKSDKIVLHVLAPK
jgi:hypothetical protein